MHIVLAVAGHVVVDHAVHAGDVQAPAGHICAGAAIFRVLSPLGAEAKDDLLVSASPLQALGPSVLLEDPQVPLSGQA